MVLGLLTLVVLFFSLGIIKSTVNYGHEITVDKPIEEAWAVHQDFSKFDQWLEGFKSIELISGEMGEVGSKYKVVVNPGEGQGDFEMTETVVAFKDFEYVDLHFDSEMMDFKQKTSFSESNGKTTIKTESGVKGSGVMMRSMFAWMELLGGAFGKQEAKNMEALKKVIEANEKDYYPTPELKMEEIMETGTE